jgi:solute carrier family 35 protein C2
MGLSPAGSHHRRRSSVLTGAGPSLAAPTEQREDHSRAIIEAVNHKRDEQKPLTADDADVSDLSSIAESVEMDFVSSDDELHDDEETGLTAQQRRQRRRRRKQRRQLDARIADVKSSRHDILSMGLADRNVVKRLLVNACLILLWYFFSLAISVVSDPSSPTPAFLRGEPVSRLGY